MNSFSFSLRYHHFNPEYVHERLRQLGQRYELRILLVQVDVVCNGLPGENFQGSVRFLEDILRSRLNQDPQTSHPLRPRGS